MLKGGGFLVTDFCILKDDHFVWWMIYRPEYLLYMYNEV